MKGAFRKISSVRSLTGGTRWYLSGDCLLAAKRMMYAVEYRRFYLRDLEYIMIWRSRWWWVRLTVPAVVFGALAASFWQWLDSMPGEIFAGIGVAWILLELALGPTARSRVRSTGLTVDLPLVMRARRAQKVLAKIDAAVRASREVTTQTTVPATNFESASASAERNTEAASAVPSIADASQTNGF